MTYLIAEIGINHDGSIEVARELINAAKRANVDAVKFQYRNLRNGVSIGGQEIGDEILDAEIKRNYLSPKLIIELSKYGIQLGLDVGISFFDVADLDDFGEDLKVFNFFKIPSVEFTNELLAINLQKYGKKILFSTGGCTEEEITAFSRRNPKPHQCILLHCVSNYPVELHNVNLGYINWLKNNYHFPVGYSSHDANYQVCIIAIGYGVEYLERHITLNKSMDGLDHSSSSNEEEFRVLSLFCKNEKLINSGFGPRKINQGEILNKQNLGRSYYAKKKIEAGQAINKKDFEYRIPKVGLNYSQFQLSLNKKLIKDIDKGQCLGINHLEVVKSVGEEKINFCVQNKIGLPVRLHDIKDIMRILPTKTYELHLSFGEVLNRLDTFQIVQDCKYSIHLPDYISPTKLIDPLSEDKDVKEKTYAVVEKLIELAKKIEDTTGSDVPLVASFTCQGMKIDNFYPQILDFLNSIKTKKHIEILPQWLPPIAWYFGGSKSLDVFNDPIAANFIIKNNLSYCLDTSHYFMCLNGLKIIDNKIINHILPLSKHFHISSASGLDGEGGRFTGFSDEELRLMEAVIFSDKRKIIEVWQGHIEGYRGFHNAINDIFNLWG